jgi:pSer/pThr/pTyr-binding forkhead associated (FHA) protein
MADRAHPTVEHQAMKADPPTVIRPPDVIDRVRSVSTVQPGAVFAVHDGTTIGRGPDVGIDIEHPAISRHHAAFQVKDETLTITDLDSLNGTLVNGQRLAGREPMALAPNDIIEVGSPEIQLQVEERSPAGTTEDGEEQS